MKIEIFEILKNQNFGFFEKFFENIFSKIELSFFDHKKFSAVTFEKINIFFEGKFFFTSSEILSTPGPLKTNSHFPSSLQFLSSKVL